METPPEGIRTALHSSSGPTLVQMTWVRLQLCRFRPVRLLANPDRYGGSMSDKYDPDEKFSLYPVDPEDALRRLLESGTDTEVEQADDADADDD